MGNRFTTRSVKRCTNYGDKLPISQASDPSSFSWRATRRRNRRSGSSFKLIAKWACSVGWCCRRRARRTHGERAASVRRMACKALRPRMSRGFDVSIGDKTSEKMLKSCYSLFASLVMLLTPALGLPVAAALATLPRSLNPRPSGSPSSKAISIP